MCCKKRLLIILLTITFLGLGISLLLRTAEHTMNETIVLTNPDTFIADHPSLLPVGQSRYFDVRYTIAAGAPTDDGQHWRYRYDLLLSNKTGQTLPGLTIRVHMTETAQKVLSSAEWYNEPWSLPPAQEGSKAHEIVYTRAPLIRIADLKQLPDAAVEDFCTLAVEILWEGGGETLLLTRADVSALTVDAELPYATFSEETLAAIRVLP